MGKGKKPLRPVFLYMPQISCSPIKILVEFVFHNPILGHSVNPISDEPVLTTGGSQAPLRRLPRKPRNYSLDPALLTTL